MKSNIQNVDPNYILINEQTLVQFGMSNMYHMMCTLLKIAEDHTSFSSSFMRKKRQLLKEARIYWMIFHWKIYWTTVGL